MPSLPVDPLTLVMAQQQRDNTRSEVKDWLANVKRRRTITINEAARCPAHR